MTSPQPEAAGAKPQMPESPAFETLVSDPEAGEPPRTGDGAPAAPAKTANKDRLAAALRENLRRRKAQRGARRATTAKAAAPGAMGDAGDRADDPDSEK